MVYRRQPFTLTLGYLERHSHIASLLSAILRRVDAFIGRFEISTVGPSEVKAISNPNVCSAEQSIVDTMKDF